MTHKMRLPDHPELEPPLTELPRLRELSRIETPSRTVRHYMLTRVQHTLNASVPSTRPKPRAHAWALSLAVMVAVPSALAATPTGALVVQNAMEWATRVWAVVDSAIALKDRTQDDLPREADPVDQSEAAHHAHQAPMSIPPAEVTQPSPSAALIAASSAHSAKPAPAPNTPAFKPTERSRTPVVPHPSRPALTATAHPGAGTDVDPRTPEPPSTLTAERLLLEAARVRLRAGDASGALVLATRHAERFPRGILVTERHAIINQVHQLQSQTR